jgi:hypothetical protein
MPDQPDFTTGDSLPMRQRTHTNTTPTLSTDWTPAGNPVAINGSTASRQTRRRPKTRWAAVWIFVLIGSVWSHACVTSAADGSVAVRLTALLSHSGDNEKSRWPSHGLVSNSLQSLAKYDPENSATFEFVSTPLAPAPDLAHLGTRG